MYNKKQAIRAAKKLYGRPICVDLLKEFPDAMTKDQFVDCVSQMVIDSWYWDESPF